MKSRPRRRSLDKKSRYGVSRADNRANRPSSLNPSFHRGPGFQHCLDVGLELGVVELYRKVGQRTSDIGRDNGEELRGGWGETTNDEIAVEENRRDLGAVE